MSSVKERLLHKSKIDLGPCLVASSPLKTTKMEIRMHLLCKKFALLGEKIVYHRKLEHFEMAQRYQQEADMLKSEIERYADLMAKTATQIAADNLYLYTVWEERIM